MPNPNRKGLAASQASEAGRLPLHTMVTLLCILSGSLDAISFLALGEAFASVMTGNIVFIGVAAGTLDSQLAVFCGSAIGGYIMGVLVGGALANRLASTIDERVWPARVTKTLIVQWCALLLANVLWVFLRGEPEVVSKLVLLAVASGVMGFQSAAVRNIGVQVSTTYMTGALTALLEAIVTRRPFKATETSAVGGLIALSLGALLGGLAITFYRPVAFLIPLSSLSVVLLLSFLSGRFSATGQRSGR